MEEIPSSCAGNEPDRVADEELVRQTQSGETGRFEELVFRYEGRLLRFLEQRCGNRHDAEDLTQKTFVCAYRAIGRFDCRRPFAPWLFVIARRLAISHGRRRKDEPLPPEEQWPAREADGSGSRDEVWTIARRRLPERHFTVLWLAYAEELPLADVGRAMGITGLHARVLLYRARQALAGVLRKEAL
jgi:RNA polymerase sigma-70 factor (ECF subfamily)